MNTTRRLIMDAGAIHLRHSGDRAKRGSPESITTDRGYGFRVLGLRFAAASLRNDKMVACPRSLGGALCRFAELFHNAVALELGEMVDEQNSVEMIDLMLQTGGEKPVGLDLEQLSFQVQVF